MPSALEVLKGHIVIRVHRMLQTENGPMVQLSKLVRVYTSNASAIAASKIRISG